MKKHSPGVGRRTEPGRRHQREQGMALPTVLVLVLVAALLVTVVGSVSLGATGVVTSGRAAAQAQASAEGGIAAARAALAATPSSLACTYTPPAGSPLRYTVEARFGPAVTGAPACPTTVPPGSVSAAPTGASVLLVATGTATRPGGNGHSSGDTRRVEAVVTQASASGPTLDKAVLGYTSIATNTGLSVISPSGSADVLTHGTFTCSSGMSVAGDVYAGGNANISSQPCTVSGDVSVDGSFSCSAGTTIGGDLYVQGDAAFSSQACHVVGNTWVGGSVTIPNGGTKFGGDLWVRGNIAASGVPAVSGTIRTGGTVAGGTGSYWHSETSKAHPGRMVENDASVGVPPRHPDAATPFPRLTTSDAVWTGWGQGDWKTSTQLLRKPGVGMSVCQMSWGGDQFADPLVVASPTVFDTTTASQCGGSALTVGAGLEIELRADAVLFVNGMTQNGDITIRSGDGSEHSLYVVQPWRTAGTACAPGASMPDPKIVLSSGIWTQDELTRILLYSPTGVHVATSPKIRGQVYGCAVFLATGTEVIHAPAGEAGDGSSRSWAVTSWRDVPSG